MTENELADTWINLDPTARQRRRIDGRVRGWLEANESSLAAEWIQLIKVNPISAVSVATVAACLVLVATPLGWMAYAAL
jgi:hypothetical protein